MASIGHNLDKFGFVFQDKLSLIKLELKQAIYSEKDLPAKNRLKIGKLTDHSYMYLCQSLKTGKLRIYQNNAKLAANFGLPLGAP